MMMKAVVLAMVLGAAAPVVAAPVCQPGQPCNAARPQLAVATSVSPVARQAPRAVPAQSRYGREIALLAGLGILGLLSRRRRLIPEVVA